MREIHFTVASVNISTSKGVIKEPVPKAELKPGHGIIGDAHAGPWHRQVSFLEAELVEGFKGAGRPLKFGEFAENITTRGVSLRQVAVLDRVRIGDVELEITQIGKECHSGCAIFQEVGACVMPKEGLFARVIKGGIITPDMPGVIVQRTFNVWIVTCSDRAYHGIYEDRSGPQIEEILRKQYERKRDHLEIERKVIPDEQEELERIFEQAVAADIDLVITTGGTGIGPRDITPDTTKAFCQRLLPGLMEYARMTFGSRKPGALLSRGVAGIHRNTFIINFPGSVKGAAEYTHLLLTHWDHIRRMIHGIDHH